MTAILSAIAFIRASRGIQIVLALMLFAVVAGIIIKRHDRAIVEADRAQAVAKATTRAIAAGHAADEALIPKMEQFNASQADLRDSIGVDDYFSRLRAQQQAGKHPATTGKDDVRR